MVDDIFDTRFEGKDVEVGENFLQPGDDFNLIKVDPSLRRVIIGVGWDVNAFNADTLDADVSLFLLNKEIMTREDGDFIFYNQPETQDGAVRHHGDSRTGAGDGDDETITVDLQTLSYDVVSIAIAVSVYKGYEKEQNLGMLRNAYVRIVNADTDNELCRYKLDQVLDESLASGAIVASLNREGPKWHLKCDTDFVSGGLGDLARRYGLIINQE